MDIGHDAPQTIAEKDALLTRPVNLMGKMRVQSRNPAIPLSKDEDVPDVASD
jgi:hypothetical protein